MTVKELKEILNKYDDKYDDYKVIIDDGLFGMENGSLVNALVNIDYHKKVCLAHFEEEDMDDA